MRENRFCSKCGKRLSEGAKFCDGCGREVVSEYQELMNEVQEKNSYPKRKSSKKTRTTFLMVAACLVLITGLGLAYAVIQLDKQKQANDELKREQMELQADIERMEAHKVAMEMLEQEEAEAKKQQKKEEELNSNKARYDKDKMKKASAKKEKADEEEAKKKEEAEDNEKKGEEAKNGHRYELVVEDITWRNAERKCLEKGGYLATLTSEEEMSFIIEQIEKEEKTNISFFVGCTRDSSYLNGNAFYSWVHDGSDINMTSDEYMSLWLPGEPSYSGNSAAGIIIEEKYVDIVYRENDKKIYLNDVSDDIISQSPNFSGAIGYICEYDK